MRALNQLTVKIFADGADKAVMLDMYAKPHIKGLTTNPTLMAKAGIRDYEGVRPRRAAAHHGQAALARSLLRRDR